MNGKPSILAVVLSLYLVIYPEEASAWDGIKSGKITGIDVTNSQNYAFRVYLDNTPICGTGQTWAYMNKDWDNYEATVSVILSAYMSGKTVTLYTDNTNGFCRIGYVSVR